MDHGQRQNLITPETRTSLLGNRIVLIAPKESTVRIRVEDGFDLAAALEGGRLAMGNVDAVPARSPRRSLRTAAAGTPDALQLRGAEVLYVGDGPTRCRSSAPRSRAPAASCSITTAASSTA